MSDTVSKVFQNALDIVPCNLPWFVWIHALGLTYVGLKLTFAPRMKEGYPAGFGTATLAVGLSYLATSWMPIEDNQFLHASVPIRFVLIAIAAYRALAMGGLKPAQKKELLGLVAWDGMGAIVTGYYLGTFWGKPLNA